MAAIAAAQSPSGAAQIVSARLTANDLKADVSFLASDALEGRGTPSPGLDIAAEYIAAQFRRAGLEPAGDDGYFQAASYANVTPSVEGMEFTVNGANGAVKAKSASMALQQAAAVDLSQAAVVKVAGSDAAAVVALTPDEVRGKVLVLDFLEGNNPVMITRQLPALAARLQPALVVLLRFGGQPTNRSTRLREATAAPTVPVLVVWDEVVRTALGSGKAGPVEASVSVHIPPPVTTLVKLRNVVGVLRGSDPALRDTYVLVTAHYDHLGAAPGQCRAANGDTICNGANDDGSGTVSVIEIASALAASPVHSKRSILFMAFFGEEKGLLGSRYYTSHPLVPLEKTIAQVNLEQVGRTDSTDGPQIDVAYVTGFDYSNLAKILGGEAPLAGVKIGKDPTEKYFERSDNLYFAQAGVPAHTVYVAADFSDYHRVGDEWQKINYTNMTRVDRGIALGLLRLASDAPPPAWNTSDPAARRYADAAKKPR